MPWRIVASGECICPPPANTTDPGFHAVCAAVNQQSTLRRLDPFGVSRALLAPSLLRVTCFTGVLLAWSTGRGVYRRCLRVMLNMYAWSFAIVY